MRAHFRPGPFPRTTATGPADDLLLIVAAAHAPELARRLPPRAAPDHVADACLAVLAGRTPHHALPETLREETAALLEWAEAAPPDVVITACERAQVAARPPRPAFRPLGAIALCQREERAGRRRFGQSDALSTAAIWETLARERHAHGEYSGAEEALEHAAEALLTYEPAAARDAGIAVASRAA